MNAHFISRSHAAVSADSPSRSSDQALMSCAKISRKRSIADAQSSRRNNRLQRRRRKDASACSDRTPKRLSRRSRAAKAGWSPERRARQAALVRSWAPWRRSTGPKTEAGKARCSMNALKHGFRSAATLLEYARVRHAIRLAARNNEIVRAWLRRRHQASHPRVQYKLWYRRLVAFKDEAALPLASGRRYRSRNDRRP
jgi:hypothetical protein